MIKSKIDFIKHYMYHLKEEGDMFYIYQGNLQFLRRVDPINHRNVLIAEFTKDKIYKEYIKL